MHEKRGLISIWFFVGVVLLFSGVLVFASGVYRWMVPPENPVVLEGLHAGVWWGVILVAAGAFYVFRFFPKHSGK